MIAYAVLFAVVFLAIRLYLRSSRKYFPGPPSKLFFGNAHEMQRSFVWEYLASLSPIYGNELYFSNPVLGMSILVLNSFGAAQDLLVQRAAIYSDRPPSTMLELMGVSSLGADRFGPKWRLGRKLFHKQLNKIALQQYWGSLEEEARMFVHRVHLKPETFLDEISLTTTRIILVVGYAYKDVHSVHDKLVTSVEEAIQQTVAAIVPGHFLINVIPALRYLPSWFPFAGDKTIASQWGEKIRRVFSIPFDYVKEQVAAGSAMPSFALKLLEGDDTDDEEHKMWLSGSMYGGGSETTATTIQWFFFALVRYPEVQLKAQEEIDRVVGVGNRLPDLTDRDQLPYVEALITELLRWFVMSPLSLPHRLMEDDIYNGCFIPKGTIVFPNSWVFSRDPDMYPDPEEFRPERFLGPSTKSGEVPMDPRKYAFGMGRRICPGLDFTDAVVFMVITTILATTSVDQALDMDGNKIRPPVQNLDNMSRKPKPFPCVIRPRSGAGMHLIDQYVSSLKS